MLHFYCMQSQSIQMSDLIENQVIEKASTETNNSAGILYLVAKKEHIELNLPIFKVGCTQQHMKDRLSAYGGTGASCIWQLPVPNCWEAEKKVKEALTKSNNIKLAFGEEYFTGPIALIQFIIITTLFSGGYMDFTEANTLNDMFNPIEFRRQKDQRKEVESECQRQITGTQTPSASDTIEEAQISESSSRESPPFIITKFEPIDHAYETTIFLSKYISGLTKSSVPIQQVYNDYVDHIQRSEKIPFDKWTQILRKTQQDIKIERKHIACDDGTIEVMQVLTVPETLIKSTDHAKLIMTEQSQLIQTESTSYLYRYLVRIVVSCMQKNKKRYDVTFKDFANDIAAFCKDQLLKKDFSIEKAKTPIGLKLKTIPGVTKNTDRYKVSYSMDIPSVAEFLKTKHLLNEYAFMFVDD